MQLDALIINPRRRIAWSAIDLGIVFAKQHFKQALLVYLLLATPVLLLSLLLFDASSMWSFLMLWWFKPLYERPVLFLMSRELFADRVDFARVIREWRSWLLPDLLRSLTIRRLNINRGFYAPVMLLERADSDVYAQRIGVLGARASSEATWLNIVLYHCENFISLALVMLLGLLMPEHFENQLSLVISGTFEVSWGSNVLMMVCMALIAPLYVSACFCLYICRRIELEGWDIEICFRDWVSKLPPAAESESVSGIQA